MATLALLGIHTLPAPRTATLVKLLHPISGAHIDTAIALTFPAPASFTGEDVLELHTHGSRAVMAALLAVLSAQPGYRLAEPGEFSRRAFENGKMDLTQAEGLADLIDAETEAQATQASRQMQGELGRAYATLRTRILIALAMLEAYIDFPDEEIPESVLTRMTEEIQGLQAEIASLLADGHRGERLREGIEIVILGPPNAGKSSLMNAIAKRDVAIVSPIAGTTRDIIELHLDLKGYPVTLLDTAGLHEAGNEIEEEGIRRAHARAANAELKLLVFDIATTPESYPSIIALEDKNTLRVYTKSDTQQTKAEPSILSVSANTGEGVEALLDVLAERISTRYASVGSSLITRARHRTALEECLAHLNRVEMSKPLELNGEELRMAARALAKITGELTVDDILDLVFSSFCIGK